MVQEARKITFSTRELIAAFEAYRRGTPGFLPEGKVVGCAPLDSAAIKVTLEMPCGNGLSQKIDRTIKGPDILKPLIRFCLENSIVLPRDGRKSITVVEGEVSISIVLNIEVDMIDHTAPRADPVPAMLTADTRKGEKSIDA